MVNKFPCLPFLPVMPGGHHLAVVFPIKGGRSKVNQADLGAFHFPDIFPLN